MSNFNYHNGIGNSSAYMVSGRPYASGSISVPALTPGVSLKVSLPNVSRWVTIINNSAKDTRVGFSKFGVEGTNYFVVKGGLTPFTLEVKTSELHFITNTNHTHTIDIVAGLTSVSSTETNQNFSGSTGVG